MIERMLLQKGVDLAKVTSLSVFGARAGSLLSLFTPFERQAPPHEGNRSSRQAGASRPGK